VNREQLEHVLRSAAAIADDPDILVIGSQSVLGSIPEHLLPAEAAMSMEVDLVFLNDPDEQKTTKVDWHIGEETQFSETNGYYAQGVGLNTATLPSGWRDRLVLVQNSNTGLARGWLLDPADCVVSKLVAGREKDFRFAYALIGEGLIDPGVVADRIEMLDVPAPVLRRLRDWIAQAF